MTMNKKAITISSLFALLCFVIFIAGIFINRTSFEALAYDNTVSYQCRQVVSICLLFFIGMLFLLMVRDRMCCNWMLLFAFPVGVCLWVFPSLLLLLLGIPYTLPVITLFLAAIMGILLFFTIRRTRLQKNPVRSNATDNVPVKDSFFSRDSFRKSMPLLLFFLGAAFLASSGLIYVFVSYDSYFYFTNYGNTLTIVKNFQDIVGDNSFTLTNISQFLPLLNSYTSFWGLDQCFQMQAFLTIDVAACFFYGLYRYGQEKTKGKVLFYSALMTAFLVTSTSFLVASTWILANMYCMAYMFFSILLLEDCLLPAKREALILTALFFAALTLLRKDGIIFVCFLMVYFMLKSKWTAKELFFVFLPSVISELWWLFYVRVILKAAVEQAAFTSIANNANVAFVIAAISATCIYLFVLHPFFERRLPFSETWLIYGGMFLLLAALTVHDWNQVVDNIDMTIRNMFLYPASWGISGILFGILLVMTFLYRPFWDEETFLWAGYVILNFISYCAVGKKLWVNWDDSYNRIVLQIIPVFVFICGKKLFSLLQLYKRDHSSES